MLCDVCHKGEAVVHFTEIIDNQITKLHLCEECARKKGLHFSFGKPLFSMADLLAGLTNFETYSVEQKSKAKCPKCGVTYNDFKNNGKLGCAECYRSFRAEIDPLLKRIHGAISHLGKVPVIINKKSGRTIRKQKMVIPIDEQIKNLQIELQNAVKNEEYEKAAIIRDKLKELKK